ncbi:MAG: biopolymer transport protein ExbD [Bacteroidetes bacterium ADurb.Bin408]|nr:MAG: biopolymer transport protein ExbD [Bacteroidetes bacterium ADurb.Bin408]
MAIKIRNKRSVEFSTASMSDIVFLLLIFFMLTSTLVSPNAIKLLLPSSNSRTMAKQTLTVYINELGQYFVDKDYTDPTLLQDNIFARIKNEVDATIVIRADKSVEVQHIVNVIDAVNGLNDKLNTKHKVILATQAAK